MKEAASLSGQEGLAGRFPYRSKAIKMMIGIGTPRR